MKMKILFISIYVLCLFQLISNQSQFELEDDVNPPEFFAPDDYKIKKIQIIYDEQLYDHLYDNIFTAVIFFNLKYDKTHADLMTQEISQVQKAYNEILEKIQTKITFFAVPIQKCKSFCKKYQIPTSMNQKIKIFLFEKIALIDEQTFSEREISKHVEEIKDWIFQKSQKKLFHLRSKEDFNEFLKENENYIKIIAYYPENYLNQKKLLESFAEKYRFNYLYPTQIALTNDSSILTECVSFEQPGLVLINKNSFQNHIAHYTGDLMNETSLVEFYAEESLPFISIFDYYTEKFLLSGEVTRALIFNVKNFEEKEKIQNIQTISRQIQKEYVEDQRMMILIRNLEEKQYLQYNYDTLNDVELFLMAIYENDDEQGSYNDKQEEENERVNNYFKMLYKYEQEEISLEKIGEFLQKQQDQKLEEFLREKNDPNLERKVKNPDNKKKTMYINYNKKDLEQIVENIQHNHLILFSNYESEFNLELQRVLDMFKFVCLEQNKYQRKHKELVLKFGFFDSKNNDLKFPRVSTQTSFHLFTKSKKHYEYFENNIQYEELIRWISSKFKQEQMIEQTKAQFNQDEKQQEQKDDL